MAGETISGAALLRLLFCGLRGAEQQPLQLFAANQRRHSGKERDPVIRLRSQLLAITTDPIAGARFDPILQWPDTISSACQSSSRPQHDLPIEYAALQNAINDIRQTPERQRLGDAQAARPALRSLARVLRRSRCRMRSAGCGSWTVWKVRARPTRSRWRCMCWPGV